MAYIEFIGKSLLLDNSILVIGDLHLGYEGAMRESGIFVKADLYGEVIRDLEKIFEKIQGKKYGKVEVGEDLLIDVKHSKINKEKKGAKHNDGDVGFGDDNSKGATKGVAIDKIILLGDLKHEFGRISRDEWKEVLELIDYLKKKCNEIIIVKGNHDVVLESVTGKKGISVVDYFVFRDFVFLHGDKDFEKSKIYDKKIKRWIVGHGHPAITLEEKRGIKKEKYKCFLVGKFKGKEIIIVPSFFPITGGSDPRDYDLNMAWNFNLNKFNVKIVGENLETFDFGKLGKLN
jgi:putative SbcD/Mre11-related phosphoesterase